MRILAEQLIAPGVECFNRRGGVPVRHEAIDASLHLLRRTIRKGKRKDLFWECALFRDEPGNATRDHLRLACARTSNDKERPFAVCYGRILLIVQVAEKVRNAIAKGTWCTD
jgi:hypothetical protein